MAGAVTATTGEAGRRGGLKNPAPAGIIDSTAVVKTALTNAASIAALMLTTQCLVTKVGEDEDALPAVEGAVR